LKIRVFPAVIIPTLLEMLCKLPFLVLTHELIMDN